MTLVKVQVNFANIGDRLRKAVERGVDQSVLAMGREMEAMLSKPGGGRVYIIRNADGKYNKRALRLLRQANVRAIKGRHFRWIKRVGLANVLRELRKRGQKNPKTLRQAGFHKASAPGQPPARNTGHLARSWQTGVKDRGPVQKDGNRYRLVVGSNVPYARFLEFGTSRMAARPYVRPVAEIMRRRSPLIVNLAVSNEVARINGGKR